MGQRYYDPDMGGRFLQVDPAREFWNSYSYVGNNPVNFFDPNGEETWSVQLGAIGGLGLGGTLNLGYVWDDQGNEGFILGGGFGVFLGVGGSVGGTIQWTDAPDIFALQGYSVNFGASWDFGAAVGADFVLSHPDSRVKYRGININIGVGLEVPLPLEAHAIGEGAIVFSVEELQNNYMEVAKEVSNWKMEFSEGLKGHRNDDLSIQQFEQGEIDFDELEFRLKEY